MSLPLEAREDLPEAKRDFTAQITPIEIIDSLASDAPRELILFEKAETDRKFLIPGHSIEQRVDTRLNPWSHLPKEAFYIENGIVVNASEPEPINRRAREDATASQDTDNLVFTSSKRQAATHRAKTNTRRGSGLSKRRERPRPQQSRRQ